MLALLLKNKSYNLVPEKNALVIHHKGEFKLPISVTVQLSVQVSTYDFDTSHVGMSFACVFILTYNDQFSVGFFLYLIMYSVAVPNSMLRHVKLNVWIGRTFKCDPQMPPQKSDSGTD